MSDPAYGPPYSEVAVAAAVALNSHTQAGVRKVPAVREVADAMHDPALGLDGSICKRTVAEWLRRMGYSTESYVTGRRISVAERFEEEFGNGR